MKTFKSDYLDTKIWFPDSNLDSIKTGYRENTHNSPQLYLSETYNVNVEENVSK